jgi:hypothetical protein
MPGIKQVVSIISDDVVARLLAASYPALVAGQILLGRQHQFEQTSPPRIIFVPATSEFAAKDIYNRSLVADAPYSDEGRKQLQQNAFLTEMFSFEVRCWGVGTDPDDDFDMTQSLYQAVLQSVKHVGGPFTRGGIEVTRGTWTDASIGSSQHVRFGREFVFGIRFATPVLSELLPFVPSDTTHTDTIILKAPDGGEEVGFVG